MDQDHGVLQDRFHALGVGHEVRREVTAIELHPLDHFEGGLHRLGLFDGDDSLIADGLHGIGDQFTDTGVIVRRNRRNLGLFLSCFHRPRKFLQGIDRDRCSLVQTALDCYAACTRRNVADAVHEYCMGKDGGGAGAVAHGFAGPFSGLTQHLGAEVFFGVFEIRLSGNRDAVIAYDGSSPFFLNENRFGARTERNAYCIRQGIGAA